MIETQELPAAIEIERNLLGKIIDRSDNFYSCHRLSAEDFSLDAHQRIYRCIVQMANAGKSFALPTLSQEIMDSGQREAVGGAAYLCELTTGLVHVGTLDSLIEVVLEKSKLRRMMMLADKVSAECVTNRAAIDIAGNWESAMLALLDNTETNDPLVSSYTVETLDKIERERVRKPGLLGLSYGISDLDEFTAGAIAGEVSVFGARPGVGKTSVLVQATIANCYRGVPVVLFSYEMRREQILRRIYSQVSGVAFARLRDPRLSSLDDMDRIRQAAAEVAEWPLRIYDNSDMTLGQLVSVARLNIRKHGARMIGVDYAQIVPADGRDDRLRVSNVAHSLAKMVKHEDASLILLSQLRKPSNAEGYSKAPHSADLRETGAIEDIAHLIVLLHRPWDVEHNRIGDAGQLIISKQRSGDTGQLDISFDRKLVKFGGV